MQVIVRERIKPGSEDNALIQRATKQLEEIVEQSTEPVTAEWDRAYDGEGRTLYIVRISDWAGAASAVFSHKQLEAPSQLGPRLNMLWGDLLQLRMEKRLQALVGAGQEDR